MYVLCYLYKSIPIKTNNYMFHYCIFQMNTDFGCIINAKQKLYLIFKHVTQTLLTYQLTIIYKQSHSILTSLELQISCKLAISSKKKIFTNYFFNINNVFFFVTDR